MQAKNREIAEATIREAARKWPSSFVARIKVPEFTGGIMSIGYLANLDSQGLGVPGAFNLGRQKAYPVDALVEWLIERLN